MEGLLKRAENDPTQKNKEKLQDELQTQMDADEAFTNKLKELVQQLHIQQQAENSTLFGGMQAIQGDDNIQLQGNSQSVIQKIFENVRAKGNITVGDITQIYQAKNNLSLAEMLRRFEEKGLGHPSLEVKENNPSWTSDIKRGVAAAFELSWEELSESSTELFFLLSTGLH